MSDVRFKYNMKKNTVHFLGTPQSCYTLLNKVIDARNIIDILGRAPEIELRRSYDEASAFLWKLEEEHPDLKAELTVRANYYFEVLRRMKNRLFQEGLITEETRNNLTGTLY